MKKKVISALLCMTMVATMLAGCGGSTGSDSSKSDAPEERKSRRFRLAELQGNNNQRNVQ